MKLFSKNSFLTRIVGIGLIVTMSLLFIFTPRITQGDWLLAAFEVMLAVVDPFIGGILLAVDAFTCDINVIWGGCDSSPPATLTPVADLKVNTDPQQVIDGATKLVPSSPSDSDGPLTVTVPNTSYIVKWASAQADNCDFTADGQTTANAGKRGNVAVTSATLGTHTYGLSCAGATDTLVVNVIGPSVSLNGTTPLEMPDPLKLNWTSSHVSSCVASGEWSGSQDLVSPAEGKTIYASTAGRRGDHTFTLTCSDELGNSAASTKTISVIQVPRCNFTATPNVITPPQASLLEWSCTYADSCVIDKGIGNVNPVSGSRKVLPPSTTTYTLTCQGADGPRSFPATVEIGTGSTSTQRIHEDTP